MYLSSSISFTTAGSNRFSFLRLVKPVHMTALFGGTIKRNLLAQAPSVAQISGGENGSNCLGIAHGQVIPTAQEALLAERPRGDQETVDAGGNGARTGKPCVPAPAICGRPSGTHSVVRLAVVPLSDCSFRKRVPLGHPRRTRTVNQAKRRAESRRMAARERANGVQADSGEFSKQDVWREQPPPLLVAIAENARPPVKQARRDAVNQ
jgi:hypothetical protein